MAHTLGEVVRLLGAILDALTQQDEPMTRLIDRREAAALFGVSEKTISRYVKATSQPRKRGRAWYDPTDVERQLRALGPLPSTKRAPPRTSQPKRRGKRAVPASSPDRSTDARVAAIEKRLIDGAKRGR